MSDLRFVNSNLIFRNCQISSKNITNAACYLILPFIDLQQIGSSQSKSCWKIYYYRNYSSNKKLRFKAFLHFQSKSSILVLISFAKPLLPIILSTNRYKNVSFLLFHVILHSFSDLIITNSSIIRSHLREIQRTPLSDHCV